MVHYRIFSNVHYHSSFIVKIISKKIDFEDILSTFYDIYYDIEYRFFKKNQAYRIIETSIHDMSILINERCNT